MAFFEWFWRLRGKADQTRPLGEFGESIAADFLKKAGMKILATNYRRRSGELDLVARDGEYIVFVEVKTRKDDSKGEPYESVGFQKQKKLTQLAWGFLKRHRLVGRPIRFDVVSILMESDGEEQSPQIQHYRAAFEAVE